MNRDSERMGQWTYFVDPARIHEGRAEQRLVCFVLGICALRYAVCFRLKEIALPRIVYQRP